MNTAVAVPAEGVAPAAGRARTADAPAEAAVPADVETAAMTGEKITVNNLLYKERVCLKQTLSLVDRERKLSSEELGIGFCRE